MNEQPLTLKQMIAVFKLWRLKRKANKLFRRTGGQQFIVKWQGKAMIIGRLQFKILRQKGLFPKNFTAAELEKLAIYKTKR